jgi:[acyl-carrier-protein] S-malonyltransferase
MPLKVSGPFHTPLMQPAADALSVRFETEAFGDMQIPVLFNCLGDLKGEETIADLLVRQVKSSVYMEDIIRRLAELGVDTIVEIGPGKALTGFVRKTAPEMTCYSAEDAASLQATMEALK